jgi:O-antigen ligase
LDGVLRVVLGAAATLVLTVFTGWATAEENWRLLVLLCLSTLTPVFIRWPVLGFGAYAFLLPFDTVSVISDTGGATVTKLVGMVAVATLLLVGITKRRLVTPPTVALFPCLLVLWAFLSIAWAVDISLTRALIQTIFSLLIMYLVAVSYPVSQEELTLVCVLTVLGGVVASSVGIIFGFEADAGHAVRGTLAISDQRANPNGVAQSLLLPLSVAIGMFLRSRRTWVLVGTLMGVAAIAYGMFMTMSRGSLVAVAAMVSLLLYRTRARSRMLLVVGILMAVIALMPELFFERITNVWTGDDSTGSGRTDIWAIGTQALESFGIIGAGLGNFPAVYDRYAYTPPLLPARGAHNIYLMTWVELGVIGLTLLSLAIVGHVRMGHRKAHDTTDATMATAVEATCFGFLIIALFGDPLWTKAFWMPWILTVWAARRMPSGDQ